MRGKKGLTRGKWVKREVEKNLAPDGEATIFLLLLCRGVIRTHVSRVAPDWVLSGGQQTEQQRRAED